MFEVFTDELYALLDVDEFVKSEIESKAIVIIDEIDKLASNKDRAMARNESLKEGVQKELLSLLEGCSVSTKHGPISTSHILFVASGAFHQSHISDLLPELQGNFSVYV